VLAEAIQTAMRAAGIPNGYEILKDMTRGQAIDLPQMRALIAKLDLTPELRRRLETLEPASYLGLATELTRSALAVK
jgi:adenylosuccinate lyase